MDREEVVACCFRPRFFMEKKNVSRRHLNDFSRVLRCRFRARSVGKLLADESVCDPAACDFSGCDAGPAGIFPSSFPLRPETWLGYAAQLC